MEQIQTIEKITLETLPSAFALLANDVSAIKLMLEQKQQSPAPEQPTWFTIDELCAYIPEHPARQTVYTWVQHKKIPNHKRGKKLFFLKSEIDAFLLTAKRLTTADATANANNYLTSKAK